MKEKLILFLISTMPDRERFLKRLIKIYLPHRHISRNPVRKSKRTNGDAVM